MGLGQNNGDSGLVATPLISNAFCVSNGLLWPTFVGKTTLLSPSGPCWPYDDVLLTTGTLFILSGVACDRVTIGFSGLLPPIRHRSPILYAQTVGLRQKRPSPEPTGRRQYCSLASFVDHDWLSSRRNLIKTGCSLLVLSQRPQRLQPRRKMAFRTCRAASIRYQRTVPNRCAFHNSELSDAHRQRNTTKKDQSCQPWQTTV